MKKYIVLFSFFLVTASLATTMVADFFRLNLELTMEETEEDGKKAENETDQDKTKISPNNTFSIDAFLSGKKETILPDPRIINAIIDAEINPPESKLA